jgi:hypothetical protein
MVTAMSHSIDEATSAFLRSAADDMQRQIGVAAAVRTLALEQSGGGVTIIASIAVGTRTVEVRGSGESLVSAYADLRRSTAAGLLATLFAELVSA